jgi:restriction system protein
MLYVLRYGSDGVISLKDAASRASDDFQLTDEERQEMIPSGQGTVIKGRTAWAVTYLVKANLLQRPKRGFFTVTEKGTEVLASNPEFINRKYLEQFPEFVTFLKKKNVTKSSEAADIVTAITSTPEERIGIAHEEITSEIESELMSKILDASPEFFERVIVSLLVSMGYGGSHGQAGEHLGKSGDGGVDGVINEDKLGLDLIYVQAKKYAPENSVGRPAIQAFAGSLLGFGATKGVFVTTSSFSKHAYEYASGVPQRIILIDGDKLTSLMLENNVGVRVNRTIELKKIDEDFFIE